ncbi:hypothetical protein BC937DRAFT_87170, partial [Endogone sp. FLAS-F59071]
QNYSAINLYALQYSMVTVTFIQQKEKLSLQGVTQYQSKSVIMIEHLPIADKIIKSVVEKKTLYKKQKALVEKLATEKEALYKKLSTNAYYYILLNTSKVSCNIDYKFEEIHDKSLDILNENVAFKIFFTNLCQEDIKKYISGLYYNISIYIHELDRSEVIISAESWYKNEVIALDTILKYFSIPFIYYTKEKGITEYSFDLKV